MKEKSSQDPPKVKGWRKAGAPGPGLKASRDKRLKHFSKRLLIVFVEDQDEDEDEDENKDDDGSSLSCQGPGPARMFAKGLCSSVAEAHAFVNEGTWEKATLSAMNHQTPNTHPGNTHPCWTTCWAAKKNKYKKKIK